MPSQSGRHAVPEKEQIIARISPILSAYGVRKAILFGSFARGSATRHSDVDLIVVVETGKRFFDRYEGILLDLQHAIAERDVELLIYTPAELEAMARRPFIARALAEGQVIYEH